MFVAKTTSCPIPIPQGKNFLFQRSRLYPSPKNFSSSPLDKISCDVVSASAPTHSHVAAHDIADYDNDDDLCIVSCVDMKSYFSKGRVHLVNSLVVPTESKKKGTFFVLCDCPKIKTPHNYLSYSLLESKKGVLVFTDKNHASILKDKLDLPYHIVELTKSDVVGYTSATKSSAIVLYNSYCDTETKTSYFLYFDFNS